jgi:hypothetical protein
MSDEKPVKRINVKFCVMIGKNASETLAQLALTYGEYAMKKSAVLERHRLSRKGEMLCKMPQEVSSEEMPLWTQYEPWCVQIKH